MSAEYGAFAVADATGFELTYQIPPELQQDLTVGAICIVPVQRRRCVGVFLAPVPKPDFECKSIEGLVPFTQPFPRALLDLIRWLGQYYLAPCGRSIRHLAPGFLWNPRAIPLREKRFAKLPLADARAGLRGELQDTKDPSQGIRLTEDQARALETILQQPDGVTLLHGVTGSGKTEVYLEAARHVIESGRNVIVLVPEIALTPQMTARFRGLFGDTLAVFHSMLTPREYEREWFRVHRDQARIVLGVRTAVFAPMQNVGLIIVDEEHDSSYKTEETPAYQSRDVAIKRASIEGARCVLGSATPSSESWSNVRQNRYRYAQLQARFSGHTSKVISVDAREHLRLKILNDRKNMLKSSMVRFEGTIVAPPIVELLQENFAKGEQSMVILNRRGFANFGICTECGESLQCPNCSVTTTLHSRGRQEICHYCGFAVKTRQVCPKCSKEGTITGMGAGTQTIEEELALAVPGMTVARLDRDIMTSNTRLGEVLKKFRDGEVNCLVGTQLLAKGHDFPKVTLVAILHVEDGLFLPDYRASERTFQLIVQASGRAGRAALPGTVAIQSIVAPHPVVELATRGAVVEFLERELELRKLGWHPPSTRQILLEFSSPKEDTARTLANIARDELISYWQEREFSPNDVRIAGPHPAAIERINAISRFQILISSIKTIRPWELVPARFLLDRKYARQMRVDVDPYSFL